MAIELDIGSAIRHPNLAKVVDAVLHAKDHDEADWIEWKSRLDLTTKEGCFKIAKTILGMANRTPGPGLACEGLGYLVIGAEPGKLSGVVTVDPAVLDQTLEQWLGGSDGPQYSPTYVHFEDKAVLVIVVESPRNGTRSFPLRKEFSGALDGDIYVRKLGRTVRANSADIRALEDRALARQLEVTELEVSLVGNTPLSWMDPTTVNEVVATWVSTRTEAMKSSALAKEHQRNPGHSPESSAQLKGLGISPGAAAAFRNIQRDLRMTSSGLGLQDRRTLDSYFAEVEKWDQRSKKEGPAVVLDRYLQAGHGNVAVAVSNPSGRHLSNVRVTVRFSWEPLSAPKREFPPLQFPSAPRAYGTPEPFNVAYAPGTGTPVSRSLRIPRSWTEKGSVVIVFDVGDLRQEETDTSETHYLLLPERPPNGVLNATWAAAIPDVVGVIRGSIDVPVSEKPVDLQSLLNGDQTNTTDEEED